MGIPGTGATATWREAGGVARCTLARGGADPTVEEYQWNNGVLKHRIKGGGRGKSVYARLDGPDGLSHVFSVWRDAIFEPAPNTVELVGRAQSGAQEVVSGQICLVLSLDSGGERHKFWFDPSKNYLIRRYRYYPAKDDPGGYFDREAEAFSEPKPGVWFPSSVVQREAFAGEIKLFARTTFRNVRVNEPVEGSLLQLKFAPGTIITDVRAGTTYTAGENEAPGGPVVPMAKPRDLNADEVQMPTGVARPGQSGSTPLWAWAACAAAVLAAAAAVYALRRRPA